MAIEFLQLAKEYKNSSNYRWQYGQAIHDSHQALGLASLRQGDVQKAKKHLIKAGKTRGGPSLNSAGPDMLLAQELLQAGESQVVLDYLDLVGRFWANEENASSEFKENKREQKAQLEQWKAEIRDNGMPRLNRVPD